MKTYLGDGVYLEVYPCGTLKLTTENGAEVTNTIVLEPEVFFALTNFLEQLVKNGLPEVGR